MSSSFMGIELGRRALAANQIALDTTGQNTSNVNTAGYSRQVVNLETTDSSDITLANGAKGQIGTGVTVSSVTRIRDQFLDQRVRSSLSQQSADSTLSGQLSQVEAAYNEPNGGGVGSLLTSFFNSFSTLSSDPANSGLRTGVRSSAQSLISGVKNLYQAQQDTLTNISQGVTDAVKQINSLATQIAGLNQQIQQSVQTGGDPNDLMDKRDQMVQNLSQLANIKVVPSVNGQTGRPTGSLSIYVGGHQLVYNDQSTPIPAPSPNAKPPFALTEANGDPIEIQGGQLGGYIKAATLVQSYSDDLNALASAVIKAVNTQHSAGAPLDGSTGNPFFTGTDASSIGLSQAIQNSTDAIAAAAAPAPPATVAVGNGDNARALAQIAQQSLLGTNTLNQAYVSQVARVGADSASAKTDVKNQDSIAAQLQSQQSSISGVSLDEELTKLIQYQRSYQVASRFITTIDDTLDRLINGLGKP